MARGGPRPGSGRKTSEATKLKKLAIKAANGEAEKSLQFCVNLRNNENEPTGLRLAAASEVMDRVWGKPKQAHELGGKDGKNIVFEVVSYLTPPVIKPQDHGRKNPTSV